MIQRIENIFYSNQNILSLIGRVFVGLAMASHGYSKLMGMKGFIGFLTKMGVPAPEFTAALVMLVELLGGILIAIGWKTRISSFMVMVTMITAAFLAHGADPFAKKEKALLYAATCLILMAFGPGKFSLDKR